MKKNGFISISVVYSFFLVFMMVLLTIITTFANNRLLLKSMKEDILVEIDKSTTIALSTYLIENYEELGLIYHTEGLSNGALDGSYRFVGNNPQNYICFGSSEDICPTDNLYRIIGVFKNETGTQNIIKIIKNTYMTNTVYWSGNVINESNNWVFSTLNTTELNVNFYNSFANEWKNMFYQYDWRIGKISYNNHLANTNTTYNHELGTAADKVVHTANIGLMYVSDYLYAAAEANWSTAGKNYSVASANNWLRPTYDEWVITANSDSERASLMISSNGNIISNNSNISARIRPCFYLKYSVFVANDMNDTDTLGSLNNPFRIK